MTQFFGYSIQKLVPGSDQPVLSSYIESDETRYTGPVSSGPPLTSVSPNSVPSSGTSTPVTIKGTGFTGATFLEMSDPDDPDLWTIKLGPEEAYGQDFTVVDDETITVTLPPGTVLVDVGSKGGIMSLWDAYSSDDPLDTYPIAFTVFPSRSTLKEALYYGVAPVVTPPGVTPNSTTDFSVPVPVTIGGTGLTGSTGVRLSDAGVGFSLDITEAGSPSYFKVVNSTTITVNFPAGNEVPDVADIPLDVKVLPNGPTYTDAFTYSVPVQPPKG